MQVGVVMVASKGDQVLGSNPLGCSNTSFAPDSLAGSHAPQQGQGLLARQACRGASRDSRVLALHPRHCDPIAVCTGWGERTGGQ